MIIIIIAVNFALVVCTHKNIFPRFKQSESSSCSRNSRPKSSTYTKLFFVSFPFQRLLTRSERKSGAGPRTHSHTRRRMDGWIEAVFSSLYLLSLRYSGGWKAGKVSSPPLFRLTTNEPTFHVPFDSQWQNPGAKTDGNQLRRKKEKKSRGKKYFRKRNFPLRIFFTQ